MNHTRFPGFSLLNIAPVALFAAIVIFKAAVSRLHDLGWAGWLVVLAFIPLVDIVVFLILFIAPGQKTCKHMENRRCF